MDENHCVTIGSALFAYGCVCFSVTVVRCPQANKVVQLDDAGVIQAMQFNVR